MGLLALTLAVWVCGCQQDTVYQTSTIYALMDGVYDGPVSLGELKGHGNFGLGTFNTLDGELILLDGVVYQMRADGKIYRPGDGVKTPFSVVTYFEPDVTVPCPGPVTLSQLEGMIDAARPSSNYPCAIRVRGRFAHIQTRSVPPQAPPYRRLAEVVRDEQVVFEMREVSGTIVGFWLPEYMSGVNVGGYHLHFLNDSKDFGGHVLEVTTENVQIEIDVCNEFHLTLPETEAFSNAGMPRDAEALQQVEKAEK